MNHLIYQDNTFDLIERSWDYSISKVICEISKNSISFADFQKIFPINEIIPEFILEFNEDSESLAEYTVIDCIEEPSCYKLVLQYKGIIPFNIEQLAANIDYLATMLDIDLEE